MKTRKILINKGYRGFGLSDKAVELYLNKKGIKFRTEKKSSAFSDRRFIFYIDKEYFSEHDLKRDDLVLIETVEELGIEEASDSYGLLKIVEIPHDVEWTLQDYDGNEWIAEKHRTWA
ncbi:MAG: hypothetical protein FJX80_00125 [Bacteroidetes bacterium]|nr:hypothetical protein [Bacteroidota bacterium]